MKINWKALIVAVYVSFISMILLLVGMSVGQKIDLVTDHYYEEELKFQGKIDKMQRSAALAKPLSWQITESGLHVHYPVNFADSSITGQISMYCPSDNRNDRHFKISTKNNAQIVALSQIPAGRYKIQIDWKSGSETYWNEGVVVIDQKAL